MSDAKAAEAESKTTRYLAREVVGVFSTSQELDNAVEQLGLAGVDRAAISVPGAGVERSTLADAPYSSARGVGDDPTLRRTSFVSHAARSQGEITAIAVPLLIGCFGGAWAVAAGDGTLIAAVGAAVLGGAVGAGLGMLLFRAVASRRAANVQAQLAGGGMILWVSTPDGPAEERARKVLQRCGGRSVHAHVVEREWGADDTPLHSVQPDPFLEREKL